MISFGRTPPENRDVRQTRARRHITSNGTYNNDRVHACPAVAPPAMTIENLRALHAIIGEAIDEIDRVYKAHSTEGTTLQFPPLDVPFYSTANNAPEREKAEELRTDPIVFSAANRIVAACGQITATVHKPFFQLVEGGQGVSVSRLFVRCDFVDHRDGVGNTHRRPRIHREHTHSRDIARGGSRGLGR